MKLYKFVSYTSLVAILLALLLLASLPFRFPNSSINWKPALLFLSPAIVLVAFLFIKPLVSRKIYLSLNVVFAAIMLWLTITDHMSPILTGIFLAGCSGLYFSRSASKQYSL